MHRIRGPRPDGLSHGQEPAPEGCGAAHPAAGPQAAGGRGDRRRIPGWCNPSCSFVGTTACALLICCSVGDCSAGWLSARDDQRSGRRDKYAAGMCGSPGCIPKRRRHLEARQRGTALLVRQRLAPGGLQHGSSEHGRAGAAGRGAARTGFRKRARERRCAGRRAGEPHLHAGRRGARSREGGAGASPYGKEGGPLRRCGIGGGVEAVQQLGPGDPDDWHQRGAGAWLAAGGQAGGPGLHHERLHRAVLELGHVQPLPSRDGERAIFARVCRGIRGEAHAQGSHPGIGGGSQGGEHATASRAEGRRGVCRAGQERRRWQGLLRRFQAPLPRNRQS
eukprot:scaffold7344_cov242-Pinguiococcus_pyrenoidosus.AAC.6